MTPSQALALQRAIEENTREVAALSQMMALHYQEQKQIEEKVSKHDIALYGTAEHKGLLQKFDIIEDKVLSVFGGLSKAFWIMTGVTVTAFCVWFWQTFIAGLMVKP